MERKLGVLIRFVGMVDYRVIDQEFPLEWGQTLDDPGQ